MAIDQNIHAFANEVAEAYRKRFGVKVPALPDLINPTSAVMERTMRCGALARHFEIDQDDRDSQLVIGYCDLLISGIRSGQPKHMAC